MADPTPSVRSQSFKKLIWLAEALVDMDNKSNKSLCRTFMSLMTMEALDELIRQATDARKRLSRVALSDKVNNGTVRQGPDTIRQGVVVDQPRMLVGGMHESDGGDSADDKSGISIVDDGTDHAMAAARRTVKNNKLAVKKRMARPIVVDSE